MAMAPAAISARPAVTMMSVESTAPARPAASANGTVSPSAIPITTSRTVSVAVKWRSRCGVLGMRRDHARIAWWEKAIAAIAAIACRSNVRTRSLWTWHAHPRRWWHKSAAHAVAFGPDHAKISTKSRRLLDAARFPRYTEASGFFDRDSSTTRPAFRRSRPRVRRMRMMGGHGDSPRLTPLDAAFLYFERPTQLLHVGCVAMLDGTPAFDELVDVIDERLGHLERYRQIPVRPRFDWGLPTWSADPHFDPHRHIHEMTLPAPREEFTLTRVVDHLFSIPLPSDRSPWEMTLVQGLPRGRSALVTKVHHCMIDGISGARVLEAIADPTGPRPTVPGAASASVHRRSTLDTVRAVLGHLD